MRRKGIRSDRESDIYSVMCKTLAAGCDFLIRSVHDRPVDCDMEEGRMGIKEYMESLPVSHTYNLHLRGHKGRKARTAKMTLRFAEVTIHKGNKCRWFIEELFSVCKSEGFRIESVQLESGAAVKKLIVLTMYAALRCVTLKRAYDEQDESVPANQMFDEQEMELFKMEMEYLYRKSPKALDGRNPFSENSLPWAAWIIARLGGWSGYVKAHGKPRYITMKKGLDRFNQHLEIIAFARIKDVNKE